MNTAEVSVMITCLLALVIVILYSLLRSKTKKLKIFGRTKPLPVKLNLKVLEEIIESSSKLDLLGRLYLMQSLIGNYRCVLKISAGHIRLEHASVLSGDEETDPDAEIMLKKMTG